MRAVLVSNPSGELFRHSLVTLVSSVVKEHRVSRISFGWGRQAEVHGGYMIVTVAFL